jgi:hypothetical protein
MSAEFQQSHHFTLVPNDPDSFDSARADHPSADPPIRWVAIGTKAYALTPGVRYSHALDNGADYYPYYDTTLHDIAPDDLHKYDHDDSTLFLRSGDTG